LRREGLVWPGARASGACVSQVRSLHARGETPLVAAGDVCGRVAVLEVGSGPELRAVARATRHAGCAVSGLDLSLGVGGQVLLASCGEDGSCVVGDLAGLEGGGRWRRLEGGRGALSACLLLALPSADCLALGGSGQRPALQLWDLRAGGAPHVVAAAQAPLSALAAHPALPFELWSGDVAGGVAAWDLRAPGRPVMLLGAAARGHAVEALRVHPDKPSTCLVAGADGHVHWLDASGEGLLCELAAQALALDVAVDELGGPLLMAAGADETVHLRQLF
jgi:hypothetical protein